jgi:hypothetical protein
MMILLQKRIKLKNKYLKKIKMSPKLKVKKRPYNIKKKKGKKNNFMKRV